MAIEVAPGVYDISLTFVHAFLVAADDGLTLIDSGTPKREQKFLRLVGDLKMQPSDVHSIVLTHHHADHMGSLAALKGATKAAIYAHAEDVPYIRGERLQPGPNRNGLGNRIMAMFMERMANQKPDFVQVDSEVTDGQELPVAGGLRVIHTPGHTPGHIALLQQSKRVLFAGDAAANLFGLRPPPSIFTADTEQAKQSLRRLAELEFDVACFGHGSVLKGAAHRRFRRLVEKMAR